MNLLRTFLHAYLYLPYGFRRLTGTGAFGRNRAEYLDRVRPPQGNSLKKALWQHYVSQFHEAACSVATVVTVINAIRQWRNDAFTPINQLEILETVRTANWKERMSTGGHNGRRGLPLPVLGAVVQSSLDAYNLPYAVVETIQARKQARLSRKIRAMLYQRLLAFEKKETGLLIAHFDQGAFVPTLNIPHISPVGGFDPATGHVTILDVDPSQPGPYKISFATFYKGLSSNYHNIFKSFGYGRGGCIFIGLL
jgi:hypothetical protein